ncbi:class I SAM-dependent methyltransferase [Anaerolentibacter hominis]|uniref:class I SAM-dependent methyltransferase n=1 Tax=Anaerolentibacter hominis TaxID=3079009 RepID=UPI0031B82B08
MNQREYWDKAAGEKEFTVTFPFEAWEGYIDRNSRILDVGCGYGRTLNELYQKGYHNLTGMDFSGEMIRRGKRQFPCLDLRIMEEGILDLPDESVDAVLLFAVLTCIRENEKQHGLLKEIRRVVKPGGVILISDFLMNSDERNRARYQRDEEKFGMYGVFELPEGAVVRHHTKEWIRELTGEWREVLFQETVHRTMNGHTSNGVCYIGQKPL